MNTSLADELSPLWRNFSLNWNSRDFAALRALWHPEVAPVYFAEEIDRPLLDWPAIESYWHDVRRSFIALDTQIMDLRSLPRGENQAASLFVMRWQALMSNNQAPIAGDTRVIANLARHGNDWKITQYVEAPLAPIVYMRKLYQRIAENQLWVSR
ncbi:MAG: hypothetical protein R3E77_09690 [Steroidobacteraceae bacterium]